MQAESRNPVVKNEFTEEFHRILLNVGEWIKSRASDRDMD